MQWQFSPSLSPLSLSGENGDGTSWMELVSRYLYVVSCTSVVKESSCNLKADKFRALLLHAMMQMII